jgi:hypothetical protein
MEVKFVPYYFLSILFHYLFQFSFICTFFFFVQTLVKALSVLGPHTRAVLPSVLTEQAKLCQVCTVWTARGFTTHAQLKLKEIDQFNL